MNYSAQHRTYFYILNFSFVIFPLTICFFFTFDVFWLQAVEVFLVRSVSIVVSDRVDETGNANLGRHRWTSATAGSGGPRSLRSIEVPTPTPTPPTPLLSSECPLSNSTNLRGPTAQRSVSIKSIVCMLLCVY